MGWNTVEPEANTTAAGVPPADPDAAWIERVAAALERLGLADTAGLVLHGVRPLGWLGGQALWAAQPVLALFGAGTSAARLARTLEDEVRFAALIAALAPTPGEEPR